MHRGQTVVPNRRHRNLTSLLNRKHRNLTALLNRKHRNLTALLNRKHRNLTALLNHKHLHLCQSKIPNGPMDSSGRKSLVRVRFRLPHRRDRFHNSQRRPELRQRQRNLHRCQLKWWKRHCLTTTGHLPLKLQMTSISSLRT
jgi:hypothetical protein